MGISGPVYLSIDARKVYHYLRRELMGLVFRLKVFRTHFTSEEAVDLMNNEAKRFFATYRIDLIEALVRVIDNFLDPARSLGQYENASLEQLIELLRTPPDCSPIQDLQAILDSTRTTAVRLKAWRNKWGSHWDRDTVLGITPQPAISVQEIAEVIRGIQLFMNKFEDYFQDARTEHVLNSDDPSGQSIQAAQEYEALKIEEATPYLELYFVPDDTDTLLSLLRRAHS